MPDEPITPGLVPLMLIVVVPKRTRSDGDEIYVRRRKGGVLQDKELISLKEAMFFVWAAAVQGHVIHPHTNWMGLSGVTAIQIISGKEIVAHAEQMGWNSND